MFLVNLLRFWKSVYRVLVGKILSMSCEGNGLINGMGRYMYLLEFSKITELHFISHFTKLPEVQGSSNVYTF